MMQPKVTYYQNFEQMPAMLTPGECANLLRLTHETILRFCKSGELPAVKFGKEWRISKQDLQSYIETKQKCWQ